MQYDERSLFEPSEWITRKITAVLRGGRVSLLLAAQLEHCAEHGTFDASLILNIIGQMEALGPDLEASNLIRPFKHPPLKDLWHAHHPQPQFMVRNLYNELKEFDFETFFRPYSGQEFTPEIARKLSREFVVDSYQKRLKEGRATGEWIIIERVKNKSGYLTLARHDEGDRTIFARVQACRAQPFLST